MEWQFGAEHLVILVNAVVVAGIVIGVGAWLGHGELSLDAPGVRQNMGEAVLSFFYGKAREIAHGPKKAQILDLATAFLASLFLFIVVSNVLAFLPVPVLNRPPTSHFSVTLALALCSVFGILIISGVIKGVGPTILHLFWPNPLQWVSEITDIMSLSLRLFGNIAGEYMTAALVVSAVPYGIPLILHVLGLIPAFVQALVFTLLTASFMGNAIHVEAEESEAPAAEVETEAALMSASANADVSPSQGEVVEA
jgi:F-type H+-transporting ATPase subunit a